MSRNGIPHSDANRRPSPFDRTRCKIGWTYARLAEESGLTYHECWKVLHGIGVTAERIDAIKAALQRGADPDRRFAMALAGQQYEDVKGARV